MSPRAIAKEPTGADKELQKKLDELLGTAENQKYVVIHRTGNLENPNMGTYRLFGNVHDEDGVMIHLMNFIDGMLDDENFAVFASMASKRALERMGLNPDNETVKAVKAILSGGGKQRGN